MAKTRVGVLLRESVGSKSSAQSADLQALTAKYQTFCKNVRVLNLAVMQHLACLQQLEKARSQVAKSVAAFSKGTPLWDASGQMPDADHPADQVCSYASVHDQLSAKTKSYLVKYQQFVTSYVVEWEKTVTTRINNGLKKVEEQRRELNHYQKKVEALRLTNNKTMAQGKSVKSDAAEKLKRNEEKLIAVKQTYNKISTQLCILMDEVADRSWRDLHPLLVKVVQFDMTLSGDEAKVLATLSQVVSKLKQVANNSGIPATPRLQDLGTLNPELLSTRPGGVAGLQIEAAPSNVSSGDAGPGTPGVGGYPMIFPTTPNMGSAPDPNQHVSRASSFSSFASTGPPQTSTFDSFSQPSNFEPPSTLSMLTISGSAAPPPTMDDIYGSSPYNSAPPPYNMNAPNYRMQSAPTSGNLPPMPSNMQFPNRSTSFSDPPNSGQLPPLPPNSMQFPNRSSSFSDYGNSGYMRTPSPVAPAPFAPPPPPPASAPPLPPGSYGSGLMVSAQSHSPYSMGSPNSMASPSYGQQQSPYGGSPWGQQSPMSAQSPYGTPPALPNRPPNRQQGSTNPFDH